jgi:hypothetical protein
MKTLLSAEMLIPLTYQPRKWFFGLRQMAVAKCDLPVKPASLLHACMLTIGKIYGMCAQVKTVA